MKGETMKTNDYSNGTAEQQEIDIQRACQWLEETIGNEIPVKFTTEHGDGFINVDKKEFISQFKQIMHGVMKTNEIGNQIGRYKIVDLYWLDGYQLLIITDNQTDRSGEDYNLEVQYYEDDDIVTYVRCTDSGLDILDSDKLLESGLLTQEEIDGFGKIIEKHKTE